MHTAFSKGLEVTEGSARTPLSLRRSTRCRSNRASVSSVRTPSRQGSVTAHEFLFDSVT